MSAIVGNNKIFKQNKPSEVEMSATAIDRWPCLLLNEEPTVVSVHGHCSLSES